METWKLLVLLVRTDRAKGVGSKLDFRSAGGRQAGRQARYVWGSGLVHSSDA
jgi:hypothetical protein